MTCRTVTIAATATVEIAALDTQRSVLIVQNSGAAGLLSLSDGPPVAQGIVILPNGGSITLRKINGEQPDKAWFGYSLLGVTLQVMELFGDVAGSLGLPKVSNPQDPQQQSTRDSPRVGKK